MDLHWNRFKTEVSIFKLSIYFLHNLIIVISLFSQVVVGSGRGRMLLFDFRQQKVVHAYRGFTGSIRQLVCHPSKPFMVSVGLDRFVRVHHLDRQTPVYKTYLKSRLNTVLIRQDFDVGDFEEKAVAGDIWNEMEVIKEKGSKEYDEEQDEDSAVNVSVNVTPKRAAAVAVTQKVYGERRKTRKIRETAS